MLRYYCRRKPGDNCRDIANNEYDEKYNQAYAIEGANWQRECRKAEKVTHLVNPYQWFTSPKPASVAVRECWRWHFISASGRALNMVLNITAISMRHSTYEARAYRNYRCQDLLSSLPMEAKASVTLTPSRLRPERQEASPGRTGNSRPDNTIAILCPDNNTDSHMPLSLFYQQINVILNTVYSVLPVQMM
ncbi:Uncharacterised protein [Salmonella enterica]|uniref:Uncharacterized protein n=1 Tax=Salmonella enterica TaxID=28901 RepID=A0A379QFA2_SALER|nr:Uncharacterised protein [Salmonella enterica]